MDLVSNNLRNKVDALMDRFFGAGVASHPTIIEQLNYLLFMRALSVKDDEYIELGITDPDKIVFDGKLAKYKWEYLMSLNAEELFTAIQECFEQIPKSTTNSTVRLVFRNAHLKLYDKPTLRIVVHELDQFAHDMDEMNQSGQRDIFGDMYEYLLSKLSQAGTSGQFRTPRHIIEFIMSVLAPKKGEQILDPAVGTAGFLVKAFEYLQKEYTSKEFAATGGAFDLLSAKEQSFLFEHTFNGFDSDEDMIKFGMMNLYLHGLENAQLVRQNSLTDTAGNRDKYDVILANPPFSGKLDRDSVAQELQMNTGATEVLFLRYMLEHLKDHGRAGVIVPEGVLFNTSGAHTKIRQLLLENGLWCTVSLPAGVFNPYSGVKTSIVFFDKSRINKKEVLFAKVEHDGFSLSTQRRSITKNDLPEILEGIKRYNAGEELKQPNTHVVKYDKIAETKDYNLSGDRYKITEIFLGQKWPMIELGEILDYEQPTKYIVDTVDYNDSYKTPVLTAGKSFVLGYTNEDEGIFQEKLPVIIFDDFTTATKFVDFLFKVKSSAMKILHAKNQNIDIKYVFYAMQRIEFSPSEHKRYWISQYSKLKIPLPPIEAQREIVEELNGYQKIIDGARQVIENYKPTLETDPNRPTRKLGELVQWASGKFLPASQQGDGRYPVYGGNGINGYHDSFTVSKPTIIVGRVGAYCGSIHFSKDKVWITDNALYTKSVNPSVNIDYLCVVLKLSNLNQYAKQGGQPSISRNSIERVPIPLPSLEQQKQIVALLEREQRLIDVNEEILSIYKQKIKDKIAEVWGRS